MFFSEWLYPTVHGRTGKPFGCGAVPPGEQLQPEHCYRGVCVYV